MEPNSTYSERYEQALRLAARVHREQNRKGTDIPYITHPVQVSLILLQHGFDEGVVIAGLLHDAVEDRDLPLAQVEAQFGARVVEMVGALTEIKNDAEGHKRPWEIRKQEALAHMHRASVEAAAVKSADTLHNARCIALDLRQNGAHIGRRFTRGLEPLLGYYRQVAQAARERLGDHPLVDELDAAVQDLADAMGESG